MCGAGDAVVRQVLTCCSRWHRLVVVMASDMAWGVSRRDLVGGPRGAAPRNKVRFQVFEWYVFGALCGGAARRGHKTVAQGVSRGHVCRLCRAAFVGFDCRGYVSAHAHGRLSGAAILRAGVIASFSLVVFPPRWAGERCSPDVWGKGCARYRTFGYNCVMVVLFAILLFVRR